MSAESNGKIKFDDTAFSSASKRVVKNLTAIGNNARTSGDKVRQSADKSSRSFDKMKQSTTSTKSAVDQLKNSANSAAPAIDKMSKSVDRAGTATAQTAIGMLGFTQGLAGMGQTVAGFNEKIVALENTILGVERSTLDVTRRQEALNAMLKDGRQNTVEYRKAVEDLALAEKGLALQTKDVEAKQATLNGEYVNFALTVFQTGFFGYIGLNAALTNLRGTSDLSTAALLRLKLAAIAQSRVFKLLIFDTVAFTTATRGATLGVAGLTIGIKAMWASLGPIGLAVLAAAAAFELWDSNIIKTQDGIRNMWEMIKSFIPVLEKLDFIIAAIVPKANEGLKDFDGNIIKANTDVMMFSESLGTAESGLHSAFDGVGEAANSASSQIASFGGMVMDINGNMINFNTNLSDTIPIAFQWADAIRKARQEAQRLNEESKKNDHKLDTNTVTTVRPDGRLDSKGFTEELDELDAIIQANTGLAIIREILQQAKQQAKAGNIQGALFLERQAMIIGRNTASISGTTNLLGLGFNRFSNLGRNVLSNSRISGQLFRGTTSEFSNALSVAGLANVSSTLGKNITGLTRSSARRRRRHSGNRTDTLSGQIAKQIRDDLVARAPIKNLFSLTNVNIFSNVRKAVSRLMKKGGGTGRGRKESRQLIRKTALQEAQRSYGEAVSRYFRSKKFGRLLPDFTQDDLLSMSKEELDRIIRDENRIVRGFQKDGIDLNTIVNLRMSHQGRLDLENIRTFRQRNTSTETDTTIEQTRNQFTPVTASSSSQQQQQLLIGGDPSIHDDEMQFSRMQSLEQRKLSEIGVT